MSLLLVEGFDLYNGLSDATRLWSSASGEDINGNARTGRASWRLGQNSGSHALFKQFVAGDEHATMIVGFGLYRGNNADSGPLQFRSDGGGTVHICICCDSNGAIRVARGGRTGTTLGTSIPNVVPQTTWHYIEAKVTLSDTVGVVIVKVDGVQVLNLTGQDTKNAGTKTVFDSMWFGSDYSLGISGLYFDDIYICNGAGTTSNDFLGECRVRTIYPSGNGALSQGVGSDSNSVDNYLLVQDITPTTGTATYVDLQNVNDEDTYVFQDLPDTSGTVAGVQISTYAQKTDTAVRQLAHVTRIGGNDYVSSDIVLGTGSFGWQTSVRDLSPATSAAWTRAEVNAAEFGVRCR